MAIEYLRYNEDDENNHKDRRYNDGDYDNSAFARCLRFRLTCH